METPDTLTIEIDRQDSATLASMIVFAVREGDPLLQMGAQAFSEKLTKAQLDQIPGAREAAEETLRELEEHGAPDEIVDQLRARIETGEPKPITEEEVEATDIDAGLAELLGNDDTKEEE